VPLKRFLTWVGYSHADPYKAKLAYVINAICLGNGLVFFAIYALWLRFSPAIPGMAVYVAACLGAFELLRRRSYREAKFLILTSLILQNSSVVFVFFPAQVAFNLFYFVVAPIAFFLYDYEKPGERRAAYGFSLAAAVLFTVSFVTPVSPIAYVPGDGIASAFRLMSAILTIFPITLVFHFFAVEIRDVNEDLRTLADTDALTGAYNRRYFFALGTKRFRLAGRTGRPFALLLLDLDFFKDVNDAWGHLSGDAVLLGLSDRVRAQVRKDDVVARYGGEEFCVLLDDATLEQAARIAESLRERIAESPFAVGAVDAGDTVHVTASIGVTEFSADYESFDDMLKAVDEAMYRAKRAGRNRVERSPGPD